MSHILWKYYLEDDVEGFRQVLDESGTATRPSAQRSAQSGHDSLKVGSPGVTGTPPAVLTRSFDDRYLTSPPKVRKGAFSDVILNRADINRKDSKGLSILHHAASSASENAIAFALALIAHPFIDLYQQDLENGWTALHRCFYFGNVTIARAILEREAQDALGEGQGGFQSRTNPLKKIKDHEGNGPFDLLTATIHDRTLHHQDMGAQFHGSATADSDDEDADRNIGDDESQSGREGQVRPSIELSGDELFTFGSNKNITLGLGNEDDRQFPERVHLKRPQHLYRRFVREHFQQRSSQLNAAGSVYSSNIKATAKAKIEAEIVPSVLRSKPITIQDVQMAKFHTAILTNDPTSNLYMCGHGTGGRLGTGDEKTQFNFVCIEAFGSSRKKIVAIGIGQDHTLAVTEQGELFSWGSNNFGQLGTGMSKMSLNAEEPNQLLPKQIFGPLKRETIVGVAASRIHSVAHTSHALYTFGKNEGQLGIVDAHARSLEIQSVPRRVAATRFSCGIQSVCAIDRATICLLENHEVRVFANYGDVKLQFPLDGFTNYYLKDTFRSTRYDERPNTIVKITGGGDTICALSSSGEVFSVKVDQRIDPGPASTGSTTNPNKIRGALSNPTRVWTLKKGHMNARDVDVDQDGSIILTTEAGSVWRRVRRNNLAAARKATGAEKIKKEFKFLRVPNLTRIIAVRASAFGAYCAVRRDCDVTRTQIIVNRRTLAEDIGALFPLRNIVDLEENTENPSSSFWTKPTPLQRMIASIAGSKDVEKDVEYVLGQIPNGHCLRYDAVVRTSVSDVHVPSHVFALAGRSRVLREAFHAVKASGSWENDVLAISADENGKTILAFKGVDFLTLVEFLLFVYTDSFVGFWLRSRNALDLAHRYRQVRVELMKIASKLEMRELESAVRRMAAAAVSSIHIDMELAFADYGYLRSGDAVVQLKDGEMLIHSDLLSRRCPFFEGLFQGRAAGGWLTERRQRLTAPSEAISIDLTHIETAVFRLVIRHIYADTGEELFDDVVTNDLDEFMDVVLDVLSVANELMLDRLSQTCQSILGRYVNVRTVCGLLNAISPSAVVEFKNSALEYTCLNLEAVLSLQLLDELDEDLLHELDAVVQDNQLSTMPFVRSGRAQALLLDKHPELAERIDRDRQAKLDGLRVQVKYADAQGVIGTSVRNEETDVLGQRTKQRQRRTTQAVSPKIASLSSVSPPLGSSVDKSHITGMSPTATSSTPSRRGPSSPLSFTPVPFTPSSADAFSDLGPSALVHLPETSKTDHLSQSIDRHSTSPRGWENPTLTPTKLGMREIMDQATASRSSGLSLALASQNLSEEKFGGSWNVRMSQKERRRIQQQRQITEQPSGKSSLNEVSEQKANAPWQTVGKSRSSTVTDQATASGINQLKRPAVQRTTTPHLTMRQTVARAPSSSSVSVKQTPPEKPPQTPPNPRSVSTPTPTTISSPPRPIPSTSGQQNASISASNSNLTSTTASKPIEIQSIRHTPKPNAQVSPTFYMHQSMADILSQQEAEKTSVKEAVAKRSLQEIQQEQEFLDWFDAESKRVMEAEAASAQAASSSSARLSRGGRGNGNAGARRGRQRPRRGKAKSGDAT